MSINWEKYGIKAPYGRSGNRKVFCPQCHDQRHDKRDKSLSINLETGEFNCHYCGFSGCAAEKEPWEKEDRPWRNAAPIRREKPVYKKPAPRQDCSSISGKALEWFKGRGISEKTLTAMKVTEGLE